MNIGIVGSEGAKFTPETEAKAKDAIRAIVHPGDVVISGACHLGGVDIWAAEIGREMGLGVREYAPSHLKWEGGYRQRNLQIARDSDWLVCITLKTLPESYKGMRFKFCYHCRTDTHVKSGGCWTMKEAKRLGRKTLLIVI